MNYKNCYYEDPDVVKAPNAETPEGCALHLWVTEDDVRWPITLDCEVHPGEWKKYKIFLGLNPSFQATEVLD